MLANHSGSSPHPYIPRTHAAACCIGRKSMRWVCASSVFSLIFIFFVPLYSAIREPEAGPAATGRYLFAVSSLPVQHLTPLKTVWSPLVAPRPSPGPKKNQNRILVISVVACSTHNIMPTAPTLQACDHDSSLAQLPFHNVRANALGRRVVKIFVGVGEAGRAANHHHGDFTFLGTNGKLTTARVFYLVRGRCFCYSTFPMNLYM